MIKKLFSVYDEKADYYMKPFVMDSVAEARRGFGDAVLDPQTAINKHPSDYRLYYIGDYDMKMCKILPLSVNKLVASGSDYITKKEV